jgi:hypothetical protein
VVSIITFDFSILNLNGLWSVLVINVCCGLSSLGRCSLGIFLVVCLALGSTFHLRCTEVRSGCLGISLILKSSLFVLFFLLKVLHQYLGVLVPEMKVLVVNHELWHSQEAAFVEVKILVELRHYITVGC